MLDCDTSLKNFVESLCVFRSEEFFCYNTARMHGCNIQQSNVAVHAGFRIYIAALTNFFASVDGLTALKCVARKDGTMVFIELCELVVVFKPHCKRKIRIRVEDLTLVTHETVIELILRLAVVTKYNSGSQRVRCIIDGHPRHICQNLTSREVRLTSIKGCFCRNDIVVAILSNLSPKLLRHRLVPRQTKFLMVNTQFNLELLKGLLLTGKVIHIRIRHIIGFAKEAICAAVDDLCREIIKLFVRIPHQPSIENMVVVSTAVEANQTESHQLFNLSRGRVNHTNHRLTLALDFPVHQEQVRKYLNIIEHELGIIIFCSC